MWLQSKTLKIRQNLTLFWREPKRVDSSCVEPNDPDHSKRAGIPIESQNTWAQLSSRVPTTAPLVVTSFFLLHVSLQPWQPSSVLKANTFNKSQHACRTSYVVGVMLAMDTTKRGARAAQHYNLPSDWSGGDLRTRFTCARAVNILFCGVVGDYRPKDRL